MVLRVGDSVFTRDGKPAVVKQRAKVSNKLDLSVKTQDIKDSTRHGYINGLSEESRVNFNDMMDSFKEIEDPEERVGEMQAQLTELDQDPRNHRISKYIRAEMIHIMSTYGIKPREFTMDASRID